MRTSNREVLENGPSHYPSMPAWGVQVANNLAPLSTTLQGASFKSCPVMDCNVDMNDPLWPSLREAARRFLREEYCVISLPQEHLESAREIVQAISDYIPSRITLPEVEEGTFRIHDIAHFDQDEPSLDICWVPNCDWGDFKVQVLELLEAGYPGCVGCAGPGAEEEWNEKSRRHEFSHKNNA